MDDLPKDDEFAQKLVKEIRPQLLNNIAVMHHTLNNFVDAEHYYSLAIQSTEASNEEEKNLKLTMSYNLARLYEEKLETEKATAIYTKLIEDYPTYVDGIYIYIYIFFKIFINTNVDFV